MLKTDNLLLLMKMGGADPIEFARKLMNEHRLSVHHGYAFACAGSSWLRVSSKESQTKKQYEAEAWEQLGIDNLVASSSSSVVSVVGLATGDGPGEVELIRNILRENYTVHYLAIDLSPMLLAAHIETIREVFDKELKDGRLLAAGVLGDVFYLGSLLEAARAEFEIRGVLSGADQFLPVNSPLVGTYLGNCLGNDSAGREGEILSVIRRTFPSNRPVAFIIGISVMRSEPDYYSHGVDDFMLQVPNYLHKELKIITSRRDESSRKPEEFTLPTNADEIEERFPAVTPQSYTNSGIEGQIYNFYYKLAFDLEMPIEALMIPASTAILLYSVTKFRPFTLATYLKNNGYGVLYTPEYQTHIETQFGPREYAVLAATINS
jgi:hypothetical protein